MCEGNTLAIIILLILDWSLLDGFFTKLVLTIIIVGILLAIIGRVTG